MPLFLQRSSIPRRWELFTTTVLEAVYEIACVWAFWCGLLGVVLSSPQLARAQSSELPRVVLLVPEDASSVILEDLEAVADRLTELAVRKTVYRTPRASWKHQLHQAKQAMFDDALVVFWLADHRGDDALYSYVPAARHGLVRRLPQSGGSAADREALLIIVAARVRALLDGVDAGDAEDVELLESDAPPLDVDAATDQSVRRDERDTESSARPASEVRAAPVEPARDKPVRNDEPARDTVSPRLRESRDDARWRLALRAGYAGRSRFLEQTRAWDSAAVLGTSYLSGAGVHLDASAVVGLSSSIVLAEQRAQLSQLPLTLAAGHAWRPAVGTLSWLTAQAVLTANWVSRETQAVEGGLLATEGDSRVVWALGARTGVAAPVWGRLEVHALLGAELPLTEYRYVAPGGDGPERSSTPRARLTLDLGASVDLL